MEEGGVHYKWEIGEFEITSSVSILQLKNLELPPDSEDGNEPGATHVSHESHTDWIEFLEAILGHTKQMLYSRST